MRTTPEAQAGGEPVLAEKIPAAARVSVRAAAGENLLERIGIGKVLARVLVEQ